MQTKRTISIVAVFIFSISRSRFYICLSPCRDTREVYRNSRRGHPCDVATSSQSHCRARRRSRHVILKLAAVADRNLPRSLVGRACIRVHLDSLPIESDRHSPPLSTSAWGVSTIWARRQPERTWPSRMQQRTSFAVSDERMMQSSRNNETASTQPFIRKLLLVVLIDAGHRWRWAATIYSEECSPHYSRLIASRKLGDYRSPKQARA